EELCLHWTDDLDVLLPGCCCESYSLTQRWIGCAGHVVGLARAECHACGIKEETGPLRLRKGPCSVACGSLHGVTRLAGFNLNGWFVFPTIVDAFEVTVEEPFLHGHVLRLQKGVKI